MASQECNVARGEDHNVVCVRLRQQNLEEVFLQFGRLAIACFFICSPLDHSLLLHFSSVRLATAYFFLEKSNGRRAVTLISRICRLASTLLVGMSCS